MQKRGRAARAERRLRSAAAESTREIGAPPLLNEDDEDQKDADDDVQNYEKYSHGFSEAMLLTGSGREFFQ